MSVPPSEETSWKEFGENSSKLSTSHLRLELGGAGIREESSGQEAAGDDTLELEETPRAVAGGATAGRRVADDPFKMIAGAIAEVDRNFQEFRRQHQRDRERDRNLTDRELTQLRRVMDRMALQLQDGGAAGTPAGALGAQGAQAVPPPVVPPPVAPAPAWTPKLKKEFSGDPRELEAFLWYVRGYIQANQALLPDEGTKIRVLVDQLTQGAASWAVATINTGGPAVVTFDAFVDALRSQFADPTRRAQAVDKLRALNQGKLTVAEYVLEFKQLLADIPDWSEEMKIREFTLGLHTEIFKLCSTRANPATFVEWAELATQMGLLQSELKARDHRAETKRKGTKPKRTTTGGGTTYPAKGPAMGKCFRCGGEGHRIADCPTPDRRKEGGPATKKESTPTVSAQGKKKKKAAAQPEVSEPDLESVVASEEDPEDSESEN